MSIHLCCADNPVIVLEEAYNQINQEISDLHLDSEQIERQFSLIAPPTKKYVDVRMTLMQASACRLHLKYNIAQIIKKEVYRYAIDQAKDSRQRWENYLLMNDMKGFFTDPDVIQWYVASLSNNIMRDSSCKSIIGILDR